MRWSEQLIPTLREAPQEAEIPSHQLLLRAGLARKLAAGLYTFLPLGLRALRKVERIVREEMDRAGALEILMPAMQPEEIWERTGRLTALKDVMFRVQDRQKRGLVLGPTHEEVVTDLAAREINSYRQLPRTLYQIQTKFRDEIRPRFGLMRAKEFIMKDAYSFDQDWDGVERSYRAMYEAYERIFARCGLRVKAVEADSGAMGGSSSHEFMVLADAGEDGLVECDRCAYAANLERAEYRDRGNRRFEETILPVEPVATPGVRTIEEVSAFLGVPSAALIKTLLVRAGGQTVAVLLPGDRELNEVKMRRVLGADAELADEAAILAATGAPVGFAGPVGLAAGVAIWADESLRGTQGGVTGANRADTHVLHVSLERDVAAAQWGDFGTARQGDGCPRCAEGTLQSRRGIEVGHVFKLGTKYSEALNATYLDAEGKPRTMIMGCYGIGVTRTLQSAIEQSHDANGLIWPIGIAPYTVVLLCLNVKDEACRTASEKLYEELRAAGVETLYDDRDDRAGVKFKDADLIGFPFRLSVGERSLAKGVVEIKRRSTGESLETPPAEAVRTLTELIRAAEKESSHG
ncbi:MAG: proline--tRNA ligase [Kiritimatiellia bacterium]|nr:proline--tRNA ligase [Kiritimatiellia bacterium]